MDKPRLSFWQIWNMSFGFLGIQFGWGLQMANMSAIYEYLGAKPEQIPMLWLAAPLTGLLVQPVIGSMSDRTWGRLGRRRPYFLVGALLSSAALVLMPNAPSLWIAAGLLWGLDASLKGSMEPFPALLGDLLPQGQRPRGIGGGVAETKDAILNTPATMRQLAWVQVCTWFGLFCMWLYFPVAVARNVFGAPNESSPLYQSGVEWGGLCFAMYSAVCFVFSFFLPAVAARLGRRNTHTLCLLCGAAGLLSVPVIHDKYALLLSMTGVGIAWASILSMPYAILAGSLPPHRTGVYMGIFNFFIVIPEIAASLGFGWVMAHLLDNNRLAAVVAGGVFLALAAGLGERVRGSLPHPPHAPPPVPAGALSSPTASP